MPKMPGFLHARSKRDQAEWDLVQSRTAARLAAMFRHETGQEPPPIGDDGTPVVVDPGVDSATASTQPAARPSRASGRRPRIVVVGDRDGPPADGARPRPRRPMNRGVGPNGWTVVDPSIRTDPLAPIEPVGVMSTPGDDLGEDIWRLPGESIPDLAPSPEPAPDPAETAVTAPVAASQPDIEAEPLEAPALVVADPVIEVHAVAARPAPVRRPAKRRSQAKVPVAALPPAPPPAPTAHCPYCAQFLDPAPTVSKRCDRCRQRIVVKRAEGRMVYLTEAAVLVFDAERRRVANAGRLTRERERWLRLAAPAGAPASRVMQLGSARLTEEVVAAARTLYLTTVDRAVRAAKRDHDWDGAARIRREQAMTLYRLAGSRVPPSADVLAAYREGVAAELRGVAEISRDAELVSARCCDPCRADDGRIFRIATELRVPRLPHAACPKGLCRCQWDLAARDRRTIRRYLQRRPGTAARAASPEDAPTVPPEDASTAPVESVPVA
jgi:hypothetical protein